MEIDPFTILGVVAGHLILTITSHLETPISALWVNKP
jgi:hypothetical protein